MNGSSRCGLKHAAEIKWRKPHGIGDVVEGDPTGKGDCEELNGHLSWSIGVLDHLPWRRRRPGEFALVLHIEPDGAEDDLRGDLLGRQMAIRTQAELSEHLSMPEYEFGRHSDGGARKGPPVRQLDSEGVMKRGGVDERKDRGDVGTSAKVPDAIGPICFKEGKRASAEQHLSSLIEAKVAPETWHHDLREGGLLPLGQLRRAWTPELIDGKAAKLEQRSQVGVGPLARLVADEVFSQVGREEIGQGPSLLSCAFVAHHHLDAPRTLQGAAPPTFKILLLDQTGKGGLGKFSKLGISPFLV